MRPLKASGLPSQLFSGALFLFPTCFLVAAPLKWSKPQKRMGSNSFFSRVTEQLSGFSWLPMVAGEGFLLSPGVVLFQAAGSLKLDGTRTRTRKGIQSGPDVLPWYTSHLLKNMYFISTGGRYHQIASHCIRDNFEIVSIVLERSKHPQCLERAG